jgi:hypothetical protein
MELYKVRDIVREQVGGADALSEAALTWAVERGLREIEKTGNFYWMEANKEFSLVVNQGSYSIYTSENNGLNLPNWKDSRILLVQENPPPQPPQNPCWYEVEGPKIAEEFVPGYTTNVDGMPRYFYKDEANTDVILQLLPTEPDKAYNMKWYYWNWTTLPADVASDDHEVLMRWPEALIYLATEQGLIIKTKDIQAGSYWRSLYKNPNPRIDSEFAKIQRYNHERSHATKIVLAPRQGSAARHRNRFPWRWSNY